MSSSELREKIIRDIKHINDGNFLEAVHSLIMSRKNDVPYELTPQQKMSIEISRKQFKTGNFKQQDGLFREVRKWLNAE